MSRIFGARCAPAGEPRALPGHGEVWVRGTEMLAVGSCGRVTSRWQSSFQPLAVNARGGSRATFR
eukprot:8569214-Lingulodinium_polyedra.AAC.1